jgi:hypothetical protein
MRLVPVWSLAALIGAGLGGCAHVRPAPSGYNVSSERSDYSPTVRLAVALPLLSPTSNTDGITVVIDSGVLSAPGARTADTRPVMRNLYLTALLATAARSGERGVGPTEPGARLHCGMLGPRPALSNEALNLPSAPSVAVDRLDDTTAGGLVMCS